MSRPRSAGWAEAVEDPIDFGDPDDTNLDVGKNRVKPREEVDYVDVSVQGRFPFGSVFDGLL